jgi:hypothetical protein
MMRQRQPQTRSDVRSMALSGDNQACDLRGRTSPHPAQPRVEP